MADTMNDTRTPSEILADAVKLAEKTGHSYIAVSIPCAERIIELLKEQEQIITSLKADLQETLKVVSEQSNVIRCKDCNKRGTSECYVENASGELAFPWIPPDDWFCADGERKEG